MKKMMINNNEEVKVTSLDLVDKINEFRLAEGKKTVLQHYDFMKKIKKELETLKTLGLDNDGNISVVNYQDKKGELNFQPTSYIDKKRTGN